MNRDVRTTRTDPAVPALAFSFAESLSRAGGGAVVGVILYGSQLQRSSPDPHSAWDLVVVVDRYPTFHRAMKASGYQRRSPWLMNLLGRILPPYVTDFSPREVGGRIAKCLVLSQEQFARALGSGARDHFLKGRLAQHVEVVWAASETHAATLEAGLASARREVLRWAGPFLPQVFDATSLTLAMLKVSFAGEIRPESRERVLEVWSSQRYWLESRYRGVLADAEAEGMLRAEVQGKYRFTRTPGRAARTRMRFYFYWSKVRVTARWFKHILTFNDWLTYIQRKVERRTGLDIEITPAERRWPLILLWPKVFRVLRQGRAEPDETQEQP